MKGGSYFVPREQIHPFMNPFAMNNEEGIYLCWETDPAAARCVLPPPLELTDPGHPIAFAYVVNIREPTFAPWYMEGGICLFCRYKETTGVHFLNLQLSGPGALMGLCIGREFYGLPKKICERIIVERTGESVRVLIESKGRRIFAVDAEIGAYNNPLMERLYHGVGPGFQSRDNCLLFQCESARASDGRVTFPKMRLCKYDSVTDYQSWEPAFIQSIQLEPSLDDPWAELSVVKFLGAGYSIDSNRVASFTTLAQFAGDEADSLISYLFAGRWDRSAIVTGHQRYGQI